MKALFEKYKQYVFIAVGLLVLWVVYTQLGGSGALSSLVPASNNTMSQEKAAQILSEQAQLASELGFLDTIRFDPTFFTGAVFNSLRDFSQPLPEETVGRPNPFAPVDGRQGTASGTTSSSSVPAR